MSIDFAQQPTEITQQPVGEAVQNRSQLILTASPLRVSLSMLFSTVRETLVVSIVPVLYACFLSRIMLGDRARARGQDKMPLSLELTGYKAGPTLSATFSDEDRRWYVIQYSSTAIAIALPAVYFVEATLSWVNVGPRGRRMRFLVWFVLLALYTAGYAYRQTLEEFSILNSEMVNRLLRYGTFLLMGCLISLYARWATGVRNLGACAIVCLLSAMSALLYVGSYAVPGFTQKSFPVQLFKRFAIIPLRSFYVSIIVYYSLRVYMKYPDKTFSRTLHLWTVPLISLGAYGGRILQTGGVSLWRSVLMEILAVGFEMAGVRALLSKRTFFEAFPGHIKRITGIFRGTPVVPQNTVGASCQGAIDPPDSDAIAFDNTLAPARKPRLPSVSLQVERPAEAEASVVGRAAQAEGPAEVRASEMSTPSARRPPHLSSIFLDRGDPVTAREAVFSMLILDSMIAEGVGSVLAIATLLLFRVALEPEATDFSLYDTTVNGLVSLFGELLVSDFLALWWICARSRDPRRLQLIWAEKGGMFLRMWAVVGLALAGSLLPVVILSLCPDFNPSGELFMRTCTKMQLDAAAAYGRT